MPLFTLASEFGEGYFHALEFGVFQTVYAAEAVVEEFRVIRVVGGVGRGGIQERHQFVSFVFVEIGITVVVVIILPFFVVVKVLQTMKCF